MIQTISTLTTEQILKVISVFGERTLDTILDKAVEIVPNTFDWKGCSIFLYDEDEDVLRLARTSGLYIGLTDEAMYRRKEGLTGWVFDKRQPLLITDLDQKDNSDLQKIDPDLQWMGKYAESDRRKAKSFIAVPLITQVGNFYGVMRTASNTHNFTERDLEIFSIVARYVAMAIENSYYFSKEKRKAEYLELLMRVGTQVLSFFELEELLKFVAENTAKTISSETCEIYLRHEENRNRLILRGGYGIPKELINVAEHQIGEGLTGTIVRENRTIRSSNVLELKNYKGKYRNVIKGHLKFGDRLSFLGMPINIKNETIGAIKLYNKIPGPDRAKHFTEDDEKHLQILVDMLSVAIENVQYLHTIKISAMKTLKNQRLTALGTLSIRIPNEVINPLTEAQLGLKNISRRLEKDPDAILASLPDRLNEIQRNLKEVADGVRVLQEFSTRAGFMHVKKTWPEMLTESLLFLTNELLTKKTETQRNKEQEAQLPAIKVDPNEIIEILVTLISLTIYRFRYYGSTLRIETFIRDNFLSTVITGIDNLEGIEIPRQSLSDRFVEAKSYSPYQFSLDVVREIVMSNYRGNILFNESDSYSRVILEIPIES